MTESKRVCFITSGNHALSLEIFHGCLDEFRPTPGIRLFSLPLNESGLRVLAKRKPAAVIAHVQSEAHAKLLRGLDVPVVNTSGTLDPFPFPTATLDNQATGRLAAEHLLSKNLRAFAYIGSGQSRHSLERLEGFQDEVTRAGFGKVSCWTQHIRGVSVENDDAYLPLAKTFRKWIHSQPGGLGIFCMDDFVAQAFLDHLVLLEDDTLDRIAVISGHHGHMPTHPSVSGVLQPISAWGREAARLAMRAIKQQEPPSGPIRVPPKGVVTLETTAGRFEGDPVVNQMIRFIHRNANKGINVQEVADVIPGLHRRTLERKFTDRMGHTILQEIQAARLERACYMLRHSDQPMERVAEYAGFSSPRHLHRVFWEQEGMTPGEYRDQGSG